MNQRVSGAMRLHTGSDPEYRLVCFAPAGAGVSPFRRWKPVVPSRYELWGICYPGREARYGEAMPAAWDLFVADCLNLVEQIPGPHVFYGHSMGALVAYEVARALEGRSQPPVSLIVSGHIAPHRHRGIDREALGETDDELATWLRDKGGVDPKILGNPDLRSMAVGLLRADLEIYGKYLHTPGTMVSADIHVTYGHEDGVAPENMQAWQELTSGEFSLRTLPGGHFFTPEVWSALPRFLPLAGDDSYEPSESVPH